LTDTSALEASARWIAQTAKIMKRVRTLTGPDAVSLAESKPRGPSPTVHVRAPSLSQSGTIRAREVIRDALADEYRLHQRKPSLEAVFRLRTVVSNAIAALTGGGR
jgi:hypothetical protein